MSKKASPAAIGGFVLGAIALLVTGIVAFSSGQFFREKAIFVSYFPGTVAGLSVGAPVQFQGVQIGQVTDIKLDYYPDQGRFDIPVHYEVWYEALRVADVEGVYDWKANGAKLRKLIEGKGLRALLTSGSLVTGQYIVTLELRPGSDYKYVSSGADVPEIPTVESTRDRLGEVLQDLDLKGLVTKASSALEGIATFVNSASLRTMPDKIDGLVADTRKLVDDLDGKLNGIATSLDTTLSDYKTLATTATARIDELATALEGVAANLSALSSNVNAQVDPLSRSALATMATARGTLEDYDALVDPQSSTRGNLDQMLEEAAGAARSLRILADYLEQNPDALIKGKY